MSIILNMIVKNESAVIERCLRSVAPWIDGYAILDTGSTDDTAEKIRAVLGGDGVIEESEFINFEQARNEALGLARSFACKDDYLLLCDADMELQVHKKNWTRKLKGDAHTVVQRTNGGLEYENLRLLPGKAEAKYVGVTHEYLDIECDRKPLPAISFFDHANGANRRDKFTRDAELLTEGLRRDPHNSRYRFYLANTYWDSDKKDLALAEYRKRLELGGWAEELFYSSYRLGICFQWLNFEQPMEHQMLRTFDQYPHRAEPLHVLALHHMNARRYHLALMFAKEGMAIPKPDGLFVEAEVYEWRLKDIAAVSLYWLGKKDDAAAINREILGVVPEGQVARIQANLEFCG